MFDYSVRFKAVDKISKKINAINKRMDKMAKKAGATSRKMQDKMGNMNFRAKLKMNVAGALANIDKVKKSMGRLRDKGRRLAINGIGLVAGGTVALAPIGKALSAYQRVQRAKGEIASLGIDNKGIAGITAEARKFSNAFAGGDMADFISASYDIKSGIASLSNVDVGKFTRLAGVTGRATKSTTAEMTKLFALGYGIFRKQFNSDIEFGNKYSAAISTAVQAFRTDGSDLVRGISTIGASAAALGVTLQEELAVMGMSKGSFQSAAEGATSYRAFLDNVVKAQGVLGLSFVDTTGKMLPMADILDKIKAKVHENGLTMKNANVQAMLKKAFGSVEAVKIISALVDKTDTLRGAQKNLFDNMQKGTAITEKMASAMQKGEEFNILGQRISNLSVVIGSIFAPIALKMSEYIGLIARKLSVWVKEHPTLAKVLGYTVGIIGALLVVLGTLSIMLGTIGVAIASVSMAMFVFDFSLLPVIGTVMLIAAAVASLGYMFYQLYIYSNDIMFVFNDLFSRFTTWISDIFSMKTAMHILLGVMEKFAKVKAAIGGFVDGVGNSVVSAWDKAKSMVSFDANSAIDNTVKNHTVVDVNVVAAGGVSADTRVRSTGGIDLRKTANGI